MVVEKKEREKRNMREKFEDNGRKGDMEREYMEIVWGMKESKKGKVEEYIGSQKRERKKKEVVNEEREDERKEIKNYEKVEKLRKREDEKEIEQMVECSIEKGRKKKIRVNMENIGNKMVGDMDYGSE